ncbi:MAG: 50S ribosome-binding GTPase [Alphaproteobacteria bacterium]|nr:50S ribosome-binding GTPase [Alphaproteobacteria bacterium]
MYNSDTIYSNFTPIAKSAVIGYRISGPLTLVILANLTNFDFSKKPNFVFYKKLYDQKKELIDIANIVYFKSPRSFTGEDIAEIYIHGSLAIASHLEKAISCISHLGIRAAKKGEFSFRAMLNNKITLKQGHSINNMIVSDNIGLINYSKKILFNGDQESALYGLKDYIVNIYSKIITTIDFTEDENFELKSILLDINIFFKNVQDALTKNRTTIEQKNILNIMIIGDVNTGKSTIFNKIVDSERAIVTNIKGTTRDIISENMIYNHKTFKIFDTAGYRKKQGKVELIGYKKALKISKNIDHFFIVFNGKLTKTALKRMINDFSIGTNYTLISNKSDIQKNSISLANVIETNRDMLRLQLLKKLKLVNIYNKQIKTGKKELSLNKNELIFLENILKKKDYLLEQKDILIIQEIIRNIIDDFSEDFGYINNEDILDNVFSKFCIGK